MSYFLWIEDFAGITGGKDIAYNVLGGIIDETKLLGDKKVLKRDLKSEGIFIELNFGDGLDFIQNKLADIDYIILDINLPAYSGSEPNVNVLKLLEKWYGYIPNDNGISNENTIAISSKALQEIAGYHLYTELVFNLGFPKENILFCSNHGNDLKSIVEAFDKAKIELPPIYKKESNEEVQAWVKASYKNSYSRLRRGIIEGCRYLKLLPEDKLQFNTFIKDNDKQVNIIDLHDYLDVLETFLPLREPIDKAVLYKLFIRTLTHEWEAAEPKNIKGLASIMKNTRNWITHNSILFNALDEKMVAYLFIINMRQIFSFDEAVQPYERILLDLYKEDALLEITFDNKNRNKLIAQDLGKAYCYLQNIASEDKDDKGRKNIRDAFRFTALANNIQESNSHLRNDKQLFTKLLYQMFWLINSYPRVDIKNREELKINFSHFVYKKNTYLFELARHIYNHSFL